MSVGLEKGLSYSPVSYENKRTNRIYRRHTNFAMESIEQTFRWGLKSGTLNRLVALKIVATAASACSFTLHKRHYQIAGTL